MQDLVDQLGELLIERNLMLAVAESCTGGLLSASITHKPGASRFYDRGFVTYSNEAKIELLHVDRQMLDMNGAVSAQTAEAMARGVLKESNADLSVSITGVAGPDGGTDSKPVGLVYFGYALKGGSFGSIEKKFTGSRKEIQTKAAGAALKHLISVLKEDS